MIASATGRVAARPDGSPSLGLRPSGANQRFPALTAIAWRTASRRRALGYRIGFPPVTPMTVPEM